jgi:hypothetical protein
MQVGTLGVIPEAYLSILAIFIFQKLPKKPPPRENFEISFLAIFTMHGLHSKAGL